MINKTYKALLLGWVTIPLLLFLFLENWLVDYVAPVITGLIALSFAVLSFLNRKRSRYRNDLIKMGLSTTCAIILFALVGYYSPKIVEKRDLSFASLIKTECQREASSINAWDTLLITEGFITIKIDTNIKDDSYDIRSSPLIFGGRKKYRNNC